MNYQSKTQCIKTLNNTPSDPYYKKKNKNKNKNININVFINCYNFLNIFINIPL